MLEKLIHKALNTYTKPTNEENSYTPKLRIERTVGADQSATYNEVFENVNKQLNK